MLRIMAGVAKTPAEKIADRQKRRIDRLNREFQMHLHLISLAQARERGDEGAKPMPFSKPKDK